MLTFHDKDADLSRLMQIREGFGKGARGLPAVVPRHNDIIQRG